MRPTSEAHEVGDEPLLIARACGVPVFVAPAPRRRRRARCSTAYPATQVIVCDDGLQHYGLQRDIEICVFDERGIGNGWLLPAGPLREPWPRAVDLVLRAGDAAGIAGFDVKRRLALQARRGDGARTPLGGAPGPAPDGRRRHRQAASPSSPCCATRACSSSRPSRCPTTTISARIRSSRQACELVCTLKRMRSSCGGSQPQAWAVPLELEIEPQFWSSLDRLVDAKLSSAHGPQTA